MKFQVDDFGILHVEGEWPSDAIGATKESLRAWQVRLEALRKGRSVVIGGASDCALCHLFYVIAESPHCANCLLYKEQGDKNCGYGETPWGKWHDACCGNGSQKSAAAEGMVNILEKTLAHLVMESEDASKVEKVEPPPEPKPLTFGGAWQNERGNVHSPTEFYVKLEECSDETIWLSAVDYMGQHINHPYLLKIKPSVGVVFCRDVNTDVLAAFGGGSERNSLKIKLEE